MPSTRKPDPMSDSTSPRTGSQRSGRIGQAALVPFFIAAAGLTACDGGEAPSVTRNRTSATLTAYQSCSELEADLRGNLREEMRTRLLQSREQWENGGYWWGGDDLAGVPEAGADGGRSDDGGRQEGVDFSGTNNQEEGVDEADMVKTDGYFIYTLNGNRLEILGVPEFGQLTQVSSTDIEGWPNQLLLSGTRAVVFSSVYPWDAHGREHPLADVLFNADGSYHAQSLVKLTVLELGESRQTPRVLRELYLEGWYLTGRRIDDVIRMASYAWFHIPGLQGWLDVPSGFWELNPLDPRRSGILDAALERALARNDAVLAAARLPDFVPRMFERRGSSVVEVPLSTEDCRNYSIPQDGMAHGFTSLITLELDQPQVRAESDHIVTNHPILYSSRDTLLIAESAQDWWWFWGQNTFEEATNIHRFRLDGARTTYTGSGRVDGTLLGQFALSAHNGIVRVAATRGQWGRWWMQDPEPPVSHLVTLGGQNTLNRIGSVDGIAPNERLWSVRFTGDEAYLVTFENIDPLWTVDLRNPAQPRILGELKVPGVSTYIHPLGDHLLTIGIAGTDDGLEWGTTQLTMFDITDRTEPTEESVLRLNPGRPDEGWSYSYSEATYEHKAFQYWGPLDLVAVPLSTWRWDRDSYEYKSELVLTHAKGGDALEVVGTVSHSDFYNQDNGWWWDFRDIRRSIFMGNYIYAISDKAVTAHSLDDLSLSASVPLRGYSSHGGGDGRFVD
jgi:hypothetical protein